MTTIVTRWVAIALLCLLPDLAGAGEMRSVPDPSITPGKICITDTAKICATKWGKDERAVTQSMKNQVFEAYGVPLGSRHLPDGRAAFEIDHLVSRELGGCDAVENLWSQPYFGPCNAHHKDRLENRLHREVCQSPSSGTLATAQEDIRADWIAAYEKRFGSCR